MHCQSNYSNNINWIIFYLWVRDAAPVSRELFLPDLGLSNVLVQFQTLGVGQSIGVLDGLPHQDLLDGHLHLLTVDGVGYVSDGEDEGGDMSGG